MRVFRLSTFFLVALTMLLSACAEDTAEPDVASPDTAVQAEPSIDVHTAAAAGDLETVEKYLDSGADVNAPGLVGSTPLHFAARAGHLEVARLLLDSGAETNVRSDPGVTPLHAAAHGNHDAMAELLIRRGADKDLRDKNHGYTPLHRAAVYGHVEVSLALLKQGADPGVRDSSGDQPVDIARHRDAAELVTLLNGYMLEEVD